MTQEQYDKMMKVIKEKNFDEKENDVARCLIALHSGSFKSNHIKILYTDCVLLAGVFHKLSKDIDIILGKSTCNLYDSLETVTAIPKSQCSLIFNLISILLKYPYIEDKDKNVAQRAYGLIEENGLGPIMHLIAKELGRRKPFIELIRNV